MSVDSGGEEDKHPDRALTEIAAEDSDEGSEDEALAKLPSSHSGCIPGRPQRPPWRLIGLLALRRHLHDQSPTCNDEADAIHHFNFFLRLEADPGTVRRYAGIADYIAEERWMQYRMLAHTHKDADAPPPALTLRRAQLVASPLVSAILAELLERLHNLSRVFPYAVQVTKDELYVGHARPPVSALDNVPTEYICQICKSYQSHPALMSDCMHTFCFVCIRHHFNKTFHCPSCNELQYLPPRVLTGRRVGIAAAIAPLVDESVVTESWIGLRFPPDMWMYEHWPGE
ncbi:hypothetical protein MKEN_00155800 [Mycena kentingensis (nom. inval.)]|nr:hypothetical protein MKEN_00155800 [Mycena kentingensis (nom. inval.)]